MDAEKASVQLAVASAERRASGAPIIPSASAMEELLQQLRTAERCFAERSAYGKCAELANAADELSSLQDRMKAADEAQQAAVAARDYGRAGELETEKEVLANAVSERVAQMYAQFDAELKVAAREPPSKPGKAASSSEPPLGQPVIAQPVSRGDAAA